jgi:hypothetical protein
MLQIKLASWEWVSTVIGGGQILVLSDRGRLERRKAGPTASLYRFSSLQLSAGPRAVHSKGVSGIIAL